MNGHPQFAEDFDLYALGVMESEEKQALEAHLRSCPECAGKLELARVRIALLGLAAPEAQAPPEARGRLLARAIGRAEPRPVTGVSSLWRWAVPILAAASVVLLFVALSIDSQNRDLSRRVAELESERQQLNATIGRTQKVVELLTASDTVNVTLTASEARPAPQAKALYHPQKGLLFYATNLPALPAGKTYQLWLVPREGNPLSAGTFQTDGRGNGQIILPELPAGVAAKAFAVTVEPGGGMPQPTGPKVLIGLAS